MNPEYPFQPQQPAQPTQPQPQPQFQPQQQSVQPGYGFGQPQTPGGQPVRHSRSKKWVIMTFVFIFTTLAVGGLSIWAVVNYFDQKNNVDSKVSTAVATAVKEQQDVDAKKFAEEEKKPNTLFVGPDDYGRLAFDYPKTWSAYEAKDATSGGAYEVYFSPGVIPPATNTQRYALRVIIENKGYDEVVNSYQRLVSSGDLKSSAATVADDQPATRLDGNFTKDIRGSAVIFKIRDKTVTLRTDADTFAPDFNALIQTIEFNK